MCVFVNVYVCLKECDGIYSKVSSLFIEDDVLVRSTRGWDDSGLLKNYMKSCELHM